MPLSEEQRTRYSRTLALRDFSERDMDTILDTSVAVVGAGGLGSPALRLLTAMGFGHIRIIDRDIVELSNLQRQTIYNTADVGKPKAAAAAANLSEMNPDVKLEPITVSIDERNSKRVLKGVDIILDGLDSFHAREAVNRASLSLSVPYIYAGAIEYYANISTFIPGRTGCLHCLMGDFEDSEETTCARVGVIPTVLSMAATVQVQEAIHLAVGREPNLANRLMTIEMQSLGIDTFEISRDSQCPICSTESGAASAETESPTVTPLCSGSFNVSASGGFSADLAALAEALKNEYSVESRTGYLRLKRTDGITVTLMQHGNAIIRGVASTDEALAIYREIIGKSAS